MISNNILKANTKSKAYKQPIKQNNSGIIHDGGTSCKVCMAYLSVFPQSLHKTTNRRGKTREYNNNASVINNNNVALFNIVKHFLKTQ